MIVVSDNSVLSCLAEIGELDLLRRLYGKVEFRLSPQIVEVLRQSLANRIPPTEG